MGISNLKECHWLNQFACKDIYMIVTQWKFSLTAYEEMSGYTRKKNCYHKLFAHYNRAFQDLTPGNLSFVPEFCSLLPSMLYNFFNDPWLKR